MFIFARCLGPKPDFGKLQVSNLVIIGRIMKLSVKYLVFAGFLLLFSGAARAQYDKDVFYFRGRQALADGKYAQSIENFNILARLDTTDYWTFFFRGIAKYNLGDLRGAHKDFDASVRINPVFTNGWHYRAITECRFGEYEKALADMQRAIDLRPGYPGIYFSRGVTYLLARQFDKAVDDFDWYIRREPKDPSAYLNRGACYLYLADTTRAFADYDKAIQLDRFDPEGYIRRGRLYAMREQYPEAIADMDKAIELDSTSTFAYFNRALMHYEQKDFNAAMSDLNRVLRDEPGNALTLYNRSLIYAQVGDFAAALDDMDRVININPRNVLAYYNRASYFVQMERWLDALDDYDAAIEIYPDFAKAYMNRSYVETQLGRLAAAKRDYDIANEKIRAYREQNRVADGSFADTTRKYSSLIALDADFAKKDFDDELLQHRDIDIRLRPLYQLVLAAEREEGSYALKNRYENPLMDKFFRESAVPMRMTSSDTVRIAQDGAVWERIGGTDDSGSAFLRALYEMSGKQYNLALGYYGDAIEKSGSEGDYERLYRGWYLMNRGVLRAEMIDFISSIENNVQTLTMDDQGTTRARIREQIDRTYDYSEALEDMVLASEILPDDPYVRFNLGNLYCLSSQMVEAIESYSKAISLWPSMGDAFFNRGLVQIYLRDKEKGCIDLSHAGELGVRDAYSVISKYCEEENE